MHEKEEQYRLLREAAGGSEEAREELVRNNLGLVKSIAYRMGPISLVMNWLAGLSRL